MTRWVRHSALAALVLMPSACTLFGSGGAAMPVLRIGIDMPISGTEGRVGTPALDGVRLYVQQHPTLDGFAVELVVKDDAGAVAVDPARGAVNIAALAADPRVMAVIGPLDSSAARAELPLANQASLALVSPAASSPCLTMADYLPSQLSPTGVAITCKEAGLPAAADLRPTGVNNFFRLSAADDLQGPAAADYAARSLGLLRVAVISDHEAYGQALAAGFTTRFRALGGSIVGHMDVDLAASPDLTGFLNLMRADHAQAVYLGGVTANKACVFRGQMAPIFGPGESGPMFGGDGIAEDPACVRDAGSNAAGIYATVPAVDATAVGTAEPVIAAFRAAHPTPADFGAYTVIAYDAAGVIYDALDRAIRSAGGWQPPRGNVISELSATQGYAGATGIFGFDPAGDSTRRVVTIFEPSASSPGGPWRRAGIIDYTAALPY